MPFTREWMPMPKAERPMASSIASLSFSLIPRLRRSPARLPMRMKRALTVVGSINGKSLKDNVKGRLGMRP